MLVRLALKARQSSAMNDDSKTASRISVALRFRPLSKAEREDPTEHGRAWVIDGKSVHEADAEGHESAAAGTSERTQYNMQHARAGKRYMFDQVLDPTRNNEDVYNSVAAPVIEHFVDGFHGTLFAYGMTSSGKTHTLMGNQQDPGLIVRAVRDVFTQLNERAERREVSYSSADATSLSSSVNRNASVV